MKGKDVLFLGAVALFFGLFLIFPDLLAAYKAFNKAHGMIMSFCKFAVLATLGEVIGLRVSAGVYNRPGFGILPRALVWGFLGLLINLAFIVFASGVPTFLATMGLEAGPQTTQALSGTQVLTAFSISAAMNLIFAPVMMTLHKVTDTHIINNGGTLLGFLRPIKVRQIMIGLNWDVMWSFVFKKTIPLFWIPAHTITFLLPAEYRVLFAALLGIALGLILAIAALKKTA